MDMKERIISLRKQKGWSQEDLAERLGVSLCILSPAVLIGAVGFVEDSGGFLSETTAVLAGLTALFLMVAAGVMQFISSGMQFATITAAVKK